ncbi:heme o synthase [Salibaculum griseiflavum]|uniref:Protoheme IX farnesyltransferase n=1 Tax=Salibaculum griseiflavum TaxID=1914409 RepID=A0A2V1P7T7_9RHOB|nr:heme o synthase [Salibaculum griseiflavum]PWG17860.1 protoheme IX farnesyltransferase [Salibaculum griseiflavum]
MTDVTQQTGTYEARMGDYFALMKPRVMQLVVFTALVGLLVAPVPVHPFIGFVGILCIAVGAGASGALNMWWDADIDAVMKRTQSRPIPSGRVQPGEALGIGLALSGFSVILLALATNLLAAGLLAFTIFFYAVIYSMWLKRSTPQNIVIGGAAGAFPPMVGWAVATGGIAPESVLMFALIFMWTPPHFWALALFVKSDYGNADVPMLTETHGRRVTRNHILGYTIALVPVALGIAFTSIGGPVYLAVALLLNGWFLKGAVDIWRRDDADSEADQHAVEKRVFKISLYYLFGHFGALLVEAVLRTNGLGGW